MISVGAPFSRTCVPITAGFAAELLPPDRFADHGNGGARLVGGLVIGAPEQRRRVEHVEERRRWSACR